VAGDRAFGLAGDRHKFGTSISAGPTMDEQIIRDLFTKTIQAARSWASTRSFVWNGQIAGAIGAEPDR